MLGKTRRNPLQFRSMDEPAGTAMLRPFFSPSCFQEPLPRRNHSHDACARSDLALKEALPKRSSA